MIQHGMKRAKVINFGSLNIDHVYRVRSFSRPGETIVADRYERFSGGKGLNQSIALANAGAQVFHAGKIGTDGRRLLDKLVDHGVNISLVEVSDDPNGHAVIQVDSSGQNSIVVYGGANFSLTADYAARALQAFGPGDMLVLQNGISAVEYVLMQGAERGLTIAFNPAPMHESVHYLPLETVQYLLLNEIEVRQFARTDSIDEAVERILYRLPSCALVLTLGSRGARYISRREEYAVPALEVETIDTTAAGDTFAGFFIGSVLQGFDIPSALERAARAASLCVTRRGAAESIPFASEVDQAYDKQPLVAGAE